MTSSYSQTYLQRLVLGKEFSPCVTITDSLEQSGLPLLIDLIATACRRNAPVLLFCIEHLPSSWHWWLSLPNSSTSRIQLVDIASNLPLSSDPTFWTSQITPVIEEFIEQQKDCSTGAQIIFDRIDALDLVVRSGPRLTRHLNQLRTLTSPFKISIVLCQSQSNPSSDALKYVSTTYVTIENVAVAIRHLDIISDPDPNDLGISVSSNVAPDLVAHVFSQRPHSGKVTIESVRVNLLDTSATYTRFPSSSTNNDSSKVHVQTDPTLGLSFNLKLTDSQRLEKEKVILPYQNAGAQQSIIHYEINLDDDVDDDDFD